MSTDVPEGNEPPRGSTGRAPRVGDSRSPVGSTLSIILAAVAVVAGFLILRELTDDDGSAADNDGNGPTQTDTDVSVPRVSDTSTPDGGTNGQQPSNSTPTDTRRGATIAVVNASGVGGSAGTMSTALETAGYEGIGEPGNSTGEQLDRSIVYFVRGDQAARAVAETLARDLGGVRAQSMPEERPVDGAGDTNDATVLLMLGTDAAGRTLEELGGETTATPPSVAGGDTTESG